MNRAAFYKVVRSKLGALKQSQVEGFEAVLDAVEGLPLSWQAYALATAWHETAKTMLPVREAYWVNEEWRKKNLRYHPFYGRGYVQLTWYFNYLKADEECTKKGLIKRGDILYNLDVAMDPKVAAYILREGMEKGWFTSKSFASYLPASGTATKEQYINARKIINGTDKDDLIEDYAQVFERGLRDAGIT